MPHLAIEFRHPGIRHYTDGTMSVWQYLIALYQLKDPSRADCTSILSRQIYFHDKWVSVTTAWRVLRLRMEEWASIWRIASNMLIKPLNPELNPICYLLALLGAHHFLHVRRIRVKSLTLRRLMSYIYIWSTQS